MRCYIRQLYITFTNSINHVLAAVCVMASFCLLTVALSNAKNCVSLPYLLGIVLDQLSHTSKSGAIFSMNSSLSCISR
jgi:hypothetical protein